MSCDVILCNVTSASMAIECVCVCRFDYTEPVDSASSVSTPPIMEEPFASDVLGDTVIKTGKVSGRMCI